MNKNTHITYKSWNPQATLIGSFNVLADMRKTLAISRDVSQMYLK